MKTKFQIHLNVVTLAEYFKDEKTIYCRIMYLPFLPNHLLIEGMRATGEPDNLIYDIRKNTYHAKYELCVSRKDFLLLDDLLKKDEWEVYVP